MSELGHKEWEAWQADPTPENLANTLDVLQPVLVSEVQRYPGPKEILETQAKQLAIKAVRTYNPAQGAALRSWVVTQMQPLSRYGQRLKPVHVPEQVRRQAAEVKTQEDQLHNDLGRMPTDAELADTVGLSVGKLRRLRGRAGAVMAESQLVTPEGELWSPGVMKPKSVDFAVEAVYQGLEPKEQLVLDWKTGMHGRTQLSNKDIAERLGVSPAYVSQISAKIAQRIQETSNRAV